MPQNITIAAFVLGAVLLLIAILHGGGFKIFGAEVDGSAGRFGRLFAGLLGVILIGIGLVGSLDKSLFQSAAEGGKTGSDVSQSGESTAPKTSEAQEKQSSQTQSGKAAIDQSDPHQTVNIAGTWHDSEGSEFRISQQGNAFTIRVTGMDYNATSKGVLHGHDFERTYAGQWIRGTTATATHFSGHCNGTISSDATVMKAQCFDETGGRGPWQSVLLR
jgi:hypothetical protein